MYGDGRWNAVAVLPTRESMNPLTGDGHFFDANQTAYVLWKMNEARSRPTRVITSIGLVSGWKIGTIIHLEHDQDRSYLGEYKITGMHDFGSMERAGDVPDMKIKHSVLK